MWLHVSVIILCRGIYTFNFHEADQKHRHERTAPRVCITNMLNNLTTVYACKYHYKTI